MKYTTSGEIQPPRDNGGMSFHDPHVTLSKIYTRTGDEGKTALVGGQRVFKNDGRIEAYGDVDELNAAVGLAVLSVPEKFHLMKAQLVRVQHELFNLGSQLATRPEDLHPKQPVILEEDVTRLEAEIDQMNEHLPPLKSFVLPGGCRLNAELHVCRTICRRAERRLITLAQKESVAPVAVRYLNRLSDYLFVMSRQASRLLQEPEVLWNPNHSA